MSEPELTAALNILRRATHRKEIILQSFVAGSHASVSCACKGCQRVYRSPTASSRLAARGDAGGEHPDMFCVHTQRLCVGGRRAGAVTEPQRSGRCDWLPLCLSRRRCAAIASICDARLTTAYIGLRRVLQINLAQAIWQACCQSVLPEEAPIHGWVSFSKGNLLAWDATI